MQTEPIIKITNEKKDRALVNVKTMMKIFQITLRCQLNE